MELIIDINGICPLKCEFCYQDLDGSVLSEDEIYRIVDNSSSRTVGIGGGEPFTDKRVVNIIKNIREKGRRVHVSTSGIAIPKGLFDLSDKLRDETQIQVSLHASNPELYKRVTGKDRFNQVIRNIPQFNEYFRTLISSVVYKENLDDLPNIIDISKNIGVPIRVELAFPVQGKDFEMVSRDEVDRLVGYLLGEKLLSRGFDNGYSIESPLIHIKNNCSALANAYGIDKSGLCPADCGKCYVSPRGEIKPCEFLPSLEEALK